jgi:hypothetical protein
VLFLSCAGLLGPGGGSPETAIPPGMHGFLWSLVFCLASERIVGRLRRRSNASWFIRIKIDLHSSLVPGGWSGISGIGAKAQCRSN